MRQSDIQCKLNQTELKARSVVSMTWLIGLYLAYCANTYALTCLPGAYAMLGWPIGGILLWGLWSIGHDSIHHAASSHPKINFMIGYFAFLPTLHPWHATKEIHIQHHKNLNNAEKDTAWNPWTISQYRTCGRATRTIYRWMRQSLWWLGTCFFLRRHYAISSPHRAKKHWHVLNLLLIACFVAGLYLMSTSLTTFLWSFLGPFVVFGLIFSTITLLHHSQVDGREIRIHWHNDSSALRKIREHTIDYELPTVIQWLIFNSNLHTLHHLAPNIPFYFWPSARKIVDKWCPNYVRCASFHWRYFAGVLRQQHLFDTKNGRLISFRDMEIKT